MGKFIGKISAEFTAPKTWELEKGLSFTTEDLTENEIHVLQRVGANVADSGRITCKKGMKTDLASVPRVVWNIIAPWDVARAAVIHDHLYATLRTYYENNVRQNKTDVNEGLLYLLFLDPSLYCGGIDLSSILLNLAVSCARAKLLPLW